MQLLTYVFGFLSVLTLVSASPFPVAETVEDYSDLPYPVSEAIFDPNGVSDVNNATIERRNKAETYCCKNIRQPWNYAWYKCGQFASIALAQTQGVVRVEAKSCARIMCWGEADIWLCNDGPHRISPNANYISSYAGDLLKDCTDVNGSGGHFTRGQKFDTDLYNVILRRGTQGCLAGLGFDCGRISHW
ncbi:hypothetical protein GLAREA_09863 [Glarea lozoyensis ATCC 20868]|uniref:Ecp2 effector protein domain-containing protein n=1 Tax=Glarea lozoyensis (strain ATCC 20868 / MF5171) TaxID=1116229 RepID=S3CQL5_GLAL2|nr:uncharacterized protein GLAREA_09863 [Glarea lozoyensis ATCC 20868]EPE28742.1 hypothetical protein GLAREA_09863 [Glarea lozoyensis ATCC 20868]